MSGKAFVLCPGCSATYQVAPTAIGKQMKCPSCDTAFTAIRFDAEPDDTAQNSRAGLMLAIGLIGGIAVAIAAAVFVRFQPARPAIESPIVAADKPLPANLRILAQDWNSVDLQWTGDFDVEAVRDAMEFIYERKRLELTNTLAKRGPQSEGKLFLLLWVARTTKFSARNVTAHFTANSGKLSHVIPPWSEAEFKETFPFDPETRPSAVDEEVYLDFLERLSQLEATFKFNPNEDPNEAFERDSKKRAELRARFCDSRGISLAEFNRIEAHNVIWGIGHKATPDAIRSMISPSE